MNQKKKIKKLNKWTTFDVVVIILAAIACIITLYPMVYVVSCSISDPMMVLAGKVKLWPVGFTLGAYEMVVANWEFWRAMLNSIIYVVSNCILMLITTIAGAYPLTRPNLKFRKPLTYFLLIPMYFSGGMIPSFLVICELGLYNNPLSLILPGAYSIWNIILCRTYMASLPNELIESALIDGSDQFRTLFKIVVPLSKPVLAVIMIYTIVGVWNSWFAASIYTTNKAIQPVQLYLNNIIKAAQNNAEDLLGKGLSVEMYNRLQEMKLASNQIKYAIIVLTTLPIIAVYPMFQKHFAKGVMLGSLKG